MQKECDHNKIQREAKRNLQRMTESRDVISGYSTQNFSQSSKANDNTIDEDKAEYWGKKVGRGLGFLFVMYLIYEIVNLLKQY